jgi:alpha-galactosidase
LPPFDWKPIGSSKVPPVLLNTWEAAYSNVSHDIEMDIARKAVTAGIELLVLDDD